jgi:hypothetical protein
MVETGAVTPVIDRTYSLNDTPEVIAYVGAGYARVEAVINP